MQGKRCAERVGSIERLATDVQRLSKSDTGLAFRMDDGPIWQETLRRAGHDCSGTLCMLDPAGCLVLAIF